MGVMRFLVHPCARLDGVPPPAQMTGFDGRTYPMRVELEETSLFCTRSLSESGRLHVLWTVDGIGPVVLSTASLRERTEPYVLALELARGTVCDLRNQAGAWDVAGLQFPADFDTVYREAHTLFRQAMLQQESLAECSALAWDAIAKAVQAGDLLTNAYIDQRMVFRQSRSRSLPVSLGCDTGSAPLGDQGERFTSVFNSSLVPINWRDVEPKEGKYNWESFDKLIDWSVEERLFVVAGPLLDLGTNGLPEWLQTWQHDFLNLQSFVSDFVETAVSRYVGRVRHWEIAASPNCGSALNLTEENRLSLTARALEVARNVDEEIQLSLMVGQPFGEYMSAGDHRLSPLQFVDALARSGVGLSEAHLDIQIGAKEQCSLPRHLLQFSRLIDQWSYLGLPLSVTLSFASGFQDDSLQIEMLKRYVPLLMAKDAVVGIYWGCHRDGVGARQDGSGLIRADGTERETYALLHDYRKKFWR